MKKSLGITIFDDLITELETYILEGGFPKSLEFTERKARIFYTESIINEIFEKDIRTKNKIKNRIAFDNVQNFIINNFSSTFSLNNVFDYFRNVAKIDITKITLRKYIDILLKAKIIYECERFDQKSKRILNGEYKFYLADLSIYYAMNTDNRINFGASLENIFYLFLISNDYKVSIGKIKKLECNFITRDIDNQYAYIQVCQSIVDPKTEEREYRPFYYINDGYLRYLLSLDKLRNQKDGIKHLYIPDVLSYKVKL